MPQLAVISNYASGLAKDATSVMSRSIGGISWNAGDYIVLTATSGGSEVYFNSPTGGGLTWTSYSAGSTHATTNPSSYADAVFFVAKAGSTLSNQTLTCNIARWVSGIPWNFQISVIRGARAVGAVAGVRGGTNGLITINTQAAGSVIYYAFTDWSAKDWSASRNWYWNDITQGFESYSGYISGYDYALEAYFYFNPSPGAKQIGITTSITGAKTTVAALEIIPDNPPSQVTGLGASATSSSAIKLTWTAATDDVGVSSYKVYRAGVVVASGVTGTTWTDSGLTAATAYSYTVSAVDTYGQEGAQSATASATTLPTAVTGSPMALSGSGALTFSAGTPKVTAPTLALSGSGTVAFSGAQPKVTGPGIALSGSGNVAFTAATPRVNGSGMALSGSGSLGLSGSRPSVSAAALDLSGSGNLVPLFVGAGYRGSPMALSGSGTLTLSPQRVTVSTALGLGGSGVLAVTPTRIVVPKTGSIPVALGGSGVLALLGKPNLREPVPLAFTGSGQLVWTQPFIKGFGRLDLSSVGTLKLDDPNAKPIYLWNGETWRPADVYIWNGRAWLSFTGKKLHIYR